MDDTDLFEATNAIMGSIGGYLTLLEIIIYSFLSFLHILL